MKKWISATCCACAFVGLAQAYNQQPIEPGLQLTWQFGRSQAAWQPDVQLALYPNDLGWRRLWSDLGAGEVAQLKRPALVSVNLRDAADVRIGAWTMQASQQEDAPNWPLRIGIGVLTVGAVWVVAMNAFGDKLEEGLTPRPAEPDRNDGDTSGGLLCVGTQCLLPCGTLGPIGSCTGG